MRHLFRRPVNLYSDQYAHNIWAKTLDRGRPAVNLKKAVGADLARCAAINPLAYSETRQSGMNPAARIVRHYRILFEIIGTLRLPSLNFLCY